MKVHLQNPVVVSTAFHLGLILLLVLIVWRPEMKLGRQKIDFEVLEFPKQAPDNVQLQPKSQPKIAPPSTRAVFGVSRKAILATEGSDTAVIKQGNTIAKEQDNLQLKEMDPDSLPIPTDDYLVSSMPSLAKEIRIPYPDEARKANVEGPVIMDLLIDPLGKVRKVELLQGPGFGLNEAASMAAYHFEFKPARVGDKNVAVKIRYTYRFVLENR